jgi:hypothetical protein
MESSASKTLSDLLKEKFEERGIITGTEKKEIGLKYDSNKPRYCLLKPEALDEMVKVLTYGANKYSVDNWKHVDALHDRYFDAAQRHLWAYRRGEKYDPESGYHHLAHAMASLMFILQTDFDEKENPPF